MILAGFVLLVNELRFFSADRIVADLGPDVPWHVSGDYPAYRFATSATPLRTLERAWCIGHEAGLRFVYLGNVPGMWGNRSSS
jgi:pyruvate formate lyase activating enzyme